jgi:hypothetical protein
MELLRYKVYSQHIGERQIAIKGESSSTTLLSRFSIPSGTYTPFSMIKVSQTLSRRSSLTDKQ